MTIQERAEKILSPHNGFDISSEQRRKMLPFIESELKAAVEDYKNDASPKELKEDWKNAFDIEIRKARNEALEKAAQVLENHGCTDCTEAIRALKDGK